MLEKILILIEIIAVAYCAYMWSEHYTKAGMVFNWLFLWSENTLPIWIHKPFIGCFKCVCAQWSMWLYLFHVVIGRELDFNLFHLFACACIGTGIGIISHKLLNDEPT